MQVSTSIFHRCWPSTEPKVEPASTLSSTSSSVSNSISNHGSTPVVFVHGLFGSIENLGMITRLLKDEFLIYAIDLPNHGRSEHTSDTSLQSMAEAIINWMDSLGLDCVDMLGHSLGGKVCMEIALRYPQRVNRVVVADIAPVAYPRRHDDVFAAFRAVDLQTIKSRAAAEALMKPYVELASTRSFLLKNLEKNTDMGSDKVENSEGSSGNWRWRINLDALESGYNDFIGANTNSCKPFNKSVLFIKGENSNYILPEHKQSILALFPSASVKVINNTDHWLHAEKPEMFAGIVRRFLSKHCEG